MPEPTVPASARLARWPLRRRVRWAVRGAALLWIAGALIVGCDSFFYYPSRTFYTQPRDLNLSFEDVWLTASDGTKLHGWFLPADLGSRTRDADSQAATTRRYPTIVHFHGNAENISNHLPLVAWLPREGFNVLLFDYRGYGRSEGRVGRAGTIQDGLAAVDYALSRPDVDKQRIVLFGQSLGGAVATVVAAERPQVAALIADCTFSSYRRIASAHLRKLLRFEILSDGLAAALVSAKYEPRDYVARIAPRPVLVITSDEDEICYAGLGRELFDAARDPREHIALPRGAHLESVIDNVEGVQTRILAFLRGL